MKSNSFIFFLVLFLIISISINSYLFFGNQIKKTTDDYHFITMVILPKSNCANRLVVPTSYFLKVIDGEYIYSSKLNNEIPFYDYIIIKVFGDFILFELHPNITTKDILSFLDKIKNKYYTPKDVNGDCSLEFSFLINDSYF